MLPSFSSLLGLYMRVAIIGTAGRDKSRVMTAQTWQWMIDAAKAQIPQGSIGVSGGAAWADHIAVALLLTDHLGGLILHLPAPITERGFLGGYGTSGGAANYYHTKFANTINVNTIQQILDCTMLPNCTGSVQPVSQGYSAMFTRNKRVVDELNPKTDAMLAFTFGKHEVADGGTKHTWDLFRGANKKHLTIP